MSINILALIPQSVLDTLKADGQAIEHWAVSEADKVVVTLKQNTGLLGVVANAIQLFDKHTALSGADKMAKVVQMAAPAIIAVLTSGQSAVAVIETEIFDLARQLTQSVYNDIKVTGAGQIAAVLGL